MPELLFPLVSLVFSAIALGLSLYVAVRYDPADVFRRLEECETSAPWAIAKQHLSDFVLETESILESAEVKLKKAHQRKGGRPRNDAQPAQAAPQGPPDPNVDRDGYLAWLRGSMH